MATKQQMQATVDTLSRMFQLVVNKTDAPTQSLFDAYNKIAEQNEHNKNELAGQVQESLEAFKKIRKELKAAYKPAKLPVSMQLPLTGSRDRALQYVAACISACKSLLEYLETAEPEQLRKARDLLSPMAT